MSLRGAKRRGNPFPFSKFDNVPGAKRSTDCHVGLCPPRNNESAQRRKHGRTRKGNPTLKTTLIQCAKTAKSKKGSFFKAQFDRLAVRRGKNRAVVAVAHSMLIAIYHMLKFETPFVDLGENYYCQFNTEKKINHYLKQLQKLGWQCPTPA